MSEERKAYILIETIGDSPRLKGEWDSWLTTWSGILSIMEDYLESLEENEETSLKFTMMYFTDEQLKEYCERNEIEWR